MAPSDLPPGSDARIDALKHLSGGGSATIGLNNERFLSARTAESVLGSAVDSVAAKTVHLLMVPLRYVESPFSKFCISSQDAAEKVNLMTLRFAAALCNTPLIDTDGKQYADWLADGMSSVQSHWNGRTPSGLYFQTFKCSTMSTPP